MTEAKASTFAVPTHVHSVIFGGGCGEAHVPNAKGEITCKVCAPIAAEHHYAPAPEGFTPPEAPDEPTAKTSKKAPATEQITAPKE